MASAMDQPSFAATFERHGLAPLRRGPVQTIQVNVGLRCDLACHHCHVEAGPKRTETMSARTAERVLYLLDVNPGITTLDLTGGAPELHAQFRPLVEGARARGRRVIDRCNLTVLLEEGQEDTAAFLAANEVAVVASLPCTSKENVDAQRGRGVFERSIEALRLLNGLGYGRSGGRLCLDLVYNPLGATLPPDQGALADRYHAELREQFGIEFDDLLTIANMPIRRFARVLAREGREQAYFDLLVSRFNPATVPALMCRAVVSVDYDGALFDCDFNQMLALPLGGQRKTVWDVDDLAALYGEGIATERHCYGCTAGAGSSCRGALA